MTSNIMILISYMITVNAVAFKNEENIQITPSQTVQCLLVETHLTYRHLPDRYLTNTMFDLILGGMVKLHKVNLPKINLSIK